MTRDEAISMIDKEVMYRPIGMSKFAMDVLQKRGVITSVGKDVAFMRDSGDTHSTPTFFMDLHFVSDTV